MPTGALLPTAAPRRLRRALAAAVLLPAALGALSACNNKRVSRIDPASVTDLSGRWNDADSRLVANALVTQALDGPVAGPRRRGARRAPPAVIVGRVANRTMEHIPVGTFVRDVERAVVTSSAVTVVASADERGRGARRARRPAAERDRRHRGALASEQGARYMLQGDVQSVEDAEGREQVVTYQVDAALVDLESNAKVWVGQHKIKKYVDRRRIGW
jgi:hypothetical protein